MAVLLAFAACKDEPEPLSGANNITSFKIGERGGAITRTRGEKETVDQDRISVVVPTDTNLGSVSPVITISGGAKVSPASGEAVNLSHPFTYVVTAENGNTRYYTVTAVPEAAPAVLESIFIATLPSKLEYYADDEALNLNGLLVTAVYSDGTEKPAPQNGVSVSGYTKNQPGIQTVTVTFGEKTATFDIEVTAVTRTSLRIVQQPIKTKYVKDEELELDGLLVEGTYSDGSIKIETVTPADIIGYDMSKAGYQTLYVKIGERTAPFTVEVTEITLTSLRIVQSPIRTMYIKGDDLELGGLLVEGTYSDGSTKIETVTPADIIGYDKNKVGSFPNDYQNLYVKIGEKTTNSYFQVTVAEGSSLSLNIGLPQDNSGDIEIYGIPTGGIELSVDGRDSKPKMVVISVGAATSNVYSSISWFIDGTQQTGWTGRNIVTIGASTQVAIGSGNAALTLNKTHDLTVEVEKDGVMYSRAIPFKIVK
jgi:hypothetical protein